MKQTLIDCATEAFAVRLRVTGFPGRPTQAAKIQVHGRIVSQASSQRGKEQLWRCHSGIAATFIDRLVRYYSMSTSRRFKLFVAPKLDCGFDVIPLRLDLAVICPDGILAQPAKPPNSECAFSRSAEW